MTVSYRIKLNDAAFRQMEANGMIAQGVLRAAGRVRDQAKRNITADGLVDTGRLRQSVEVTRHRGKTGVWWEVGSRMFYARWTHEGTKAHGPRRARMLRFTPKGSKTVVYARRVKGIRGTKWLTRALKELRASDFRP